MIEWLFLLIVVVVALWVIATYNRFIRLKNAIEATFGQIQVAMKKRLDKIGRLVESASSYLKFEKDVQTSIAKLRSAPMKTPEEVSKVGRELAGLIGSIRVAVENYPDLKGKEPVMKLMNEIDDMEDEIGRLRYLYNDQVRMFNNMVEMFPSSIVAALFGFGKKPYLDFGKEVETPPSAKLY